MLNFGSLLAQKYAIQQQEADARSAAVDAHMSEIANEREMLPYRRDLIRAQTGQVRENTRLLEPSTMADIAGQDAKTNAANYMLDRLQEKGMWKQYDDGSFERDPLADPYSPVPMRGLMSLKQTNLGRPKGLGGLPRVATMDDGMSPVTSREEAFGKSTGYLAGLPPKRPPLGSRGLPSSNVYKTPSTSWDGRDRDGNRPSPLWDPYRYGQ